MRVVVLLSLILLSACQTPKPRMRFTRIGDWTDQQMEKDRTECESMNPYIQGGYAFEVRRDYFQRCMFGKGWTRIKEPSEED